MEFDKLFLTAMPGYLNKTTSTYRNGTRELPNFSTRLKGQSDNLCKYNVTPVLDDAKP